MYKMYNHIILYLETVDGVFKELVPKPEAFSRGLYTFDIGQNDLTGGLLLNLSIDQVKASIPDILGQFKTVVKVRIAYQLLYIVVVLTFSGCFSDRMCMIKEGDTFGYTILAQLVVYHTY